MARDEDGTIAGFAEAALRRDYVNGCYTTPVVFLEAIYVEPHHRRRGIARALVKHLVDWARSQGYSEFASDAALDNLVSHSMHKALGFTETERVVFFRMNV
jgi:aminoglycoside 6'-N-acetyltransferase I